MSDIGQSGDPEEQPAGAPPPEAGEDGGDAVDFAAPTMVQADGRPRFGAPDPGAPLPPPGTTDYEVIEQIGAGGMGVVYEAYQTSLRRNIAMKVHRPSPEAAPEQVSARLAEFTREAHITASLDHPHVVPVYSLSCSPEGRPFFTMKRVTGLSWRDVLHPDRVRDDMARAEAERVARTMSLRDHLEVLRTVAEAVAYGHSKGILHRDLKPENVLLGKYGQVYVMDWGLAMYFDERNPYRGLQPDAAPVSGSPVYMSPEMARGELAALGPPSDVYQLGAILYELLTGAPPPRGTTVPEIMANAASGRVPPPEAVSDAPEINADISRIAMKALAAEPADRYPTVPEFQAELEEYMAHAASLDQTRRSGQLLDSLCRDLAADPDAAPVLVADVGKSAAALLYGRLSECIGGLRQAIAVWPGNRRASRLLADALTLHVALATRQGDLTLAKAQLAALRAPPLAHCPDAETAARITAREKGLEDTILRKERSAAATARQLRRLRAAAALLSVAVLLGVSAVIWTTLRARSRALRHEEEMFVSAVAGQARMVEKHFEMFERVAARYRQEAVRLMSLPAAHLPFQPVTPAGRDGFYYDEDFYVPATRPPDLRRDARYRHPVSMTEATVVRAPWARDGEALERAAADAVRLARLATVFAQTHRAHPEILWSLAGTRTGLLVGFPGSGRYGDKPEYDPTQRTWYQAAIPALDDRPVWGVPYADASSRQLLMSCMCRIALAGETIGVVGLELTLESLHGVLSDFHAAETKQVRCLLVRRFEEAEPHTGSPRVVDRILTDTAAATRAEHWQDVPEMPPVEQAGGLVAGLYLRASAAGAPPSACVREGGHLMAYARLPRMGWILLVIVTDRR